jgi:enoyl-CoA hydratase/3-hydroxyacyl-CoA dehydrogenase
MICLGRPLKVEEALDIGMVTRIVDDYAELISTAVETVVSLQGKIDRIPDGQVDIPKFRIPETPKTGSQALSKEAVSLTLKVIQEGAQAADFNDALEIGYQGFGKITCTDAAKEGVAAFLAKRPPVFKK